MDEPPTMIPKEEALSQIQLALRRTALLHHYFAQTLVDEFGEERGFQLVRQAVDAYGTHIGREAKNRALELGRGTAPEGFPSDLPDFAWKTEVITVEGEERYRVHDCPLAREWMDWGDTRNARLYCFVDQAKMRGFNPEYEYVHIKNVLDGDPYCELAIRPVPEEAAKAVAQPSVREDPSSEPTVTCVHRKYTKKDLMEMDPACLRALFRERIHHTIEVELYPILLGRKKLPKNFGLQPQLIYDVWRERGLSCDDADLKWGEQYLEFARKLQKGDEVSPASELPLPFSEQELEAIKKLIWRRHSIRDWIPGKEVPEDKIELILEAGRAAPTACNLDIVRYAVIRDPEEAKLVWSDIPTPMDSCVLIVVCYDTRIYKTVGHNELVPHNQLYDCAAAADHMCLMAHALGLGAVWLTRTEKTAKAFKEKYELPEYIEPALHVAVGWPAVGTVKSARMPLKEMMLTK